MKKFICVLPLCFLPLHAYALDCGSRKAITEVQIKNAQEEWARGIVSIGRAENPRAEASAMLDRLYAFDRGPVLFKPTKAAEPAFRPTRDEALSYFVGGRYAEDKGFALAPFTNVRFENTRTIPGCDMALSQGNYYFRDAKGQETKVEFTFGYAPDKEGRPRIILQHSSLPYKK